MTSFQIHVSRHRRAAARYVADVRRKIQMAFAESPLSQSDVARALGVHRSVISREVRGHKDLTLGRVAEIACLLGYTATFELKTVEVVQDNNNAPMIEPESVKATWNGNAAPQQIHVVQIHKDIMGAKPTHSASTETLTPSKDKWIRQHAHAD